jgi:hypothetical protein
MNIIEENVSERVIFFVAIVAIISLIALGIHFYLGERGVKIDLEPEDKIENNNSYENNGWKLPEDPNDNEVIPGSGEPPVAKIDCQPGPDCYPQTECMAYRGCNFVLVNDSFDLDDDVILYEWQVRKEEEDFFRSEVSCQVSVDGKCDYTVQPFLPLGNYIVKLYAEDRAGNFNSTTESFSILREVRAGFECSLVGGDNPSDYFSCDKLTFSEKKTIYFKYDLPSPHENSQSSEGAEIDISKSLWQSESEEWSAIGHPVVSREAEKGESILLTIVDNNNRKNSVSHIIGKRNVPVWGSK